MSLVTEYSRENPSKRYRELLRLYQEMHAHGTTQSGAGSSEMYMGRSLLPHLDTIQALIQKTGARSLLDYGSGKGALYKARNIVLKNGSTIPSVQEYLGLDRIVCFDPGVPEYSKFPPEKFDGVVSTDVLEHCPEEDMRWIVGEMFGAAGKFVFANVASYPAKKQLPNGENAHCTQQPVGWWRNLLGEISSRHPGVIYQFEIKELSGLPEFLARALGKRFKTSVAENAG